MKSHRRTFLQGSALGALSLLAGSQLRNARAGDPGPAPKANALIVLWMNGGASHIDTFDPKMGHKNAGPFKAIKTRAPGVELCEHLPQLADQADKLAIVRSVTSKEGNHERARFYGHTGYAPNPTVDYPSMGAWLSSERPGTSTLPSFVSVNGPSAGGGFLGMEHAPFIMRKPGGLPENVALGFGVDRERLSRRLDNLDFMENRFAKQTGDASVRSRQKIYTRANRMVQGKDINAFDLSDEPKALRDAYGNNEFGRGCLLARRLVESGVRVVEVMQRGWDTHFDTFDRSKKLMGALDPGMATLIRDLADRGLLDETLVLWMGDFGRTPRINARDGRDHYPRAWSVAMAGGGVRGGVAYGATDEGGAKVVEKAVTVPDLWATVAGQLGVDPAKTVMTPGGRPITMTDMGNPITGILAG